MRHAVAIVTLFGLLMLVSLKAGSIEGAGLELPIPGDPQLIRCMDEGGEVLKPFAGHGRHRIHVERAVDDAPCVASTPFGDPLRAS